LLLCLATSLLAMSGCVIPVAPDFQDPLPNYPPTLAAQSPPFGDLLHVSSDPNSPQEFNVLVWDPNSDTLFVQWAIDYPVVASGGVPVTIGGIAQVPTDAQGQPTPVSKAITCLNVPSATPDSLHRLEIIVSDRKPNVQTLDSLDDVPKPGYVVHGDWSFYCVSGSGSP
jgi:hypothetical protein